MCTVCTVNIMKLSRSPTGILMVTIVTCAVKYYNTIIKLLSLVGAPSYLAELGLAGGR